MKKLVGSPGTKTGLILRLGQCGFATASIAFMVSTSNFQNLVIDVVFLPRKRNIHLRTLVSVLGLQLLWSFGLACLDVYALRTKRDLQSPVLVPVLASGDWVTAMLTLAATCSSAGVVLLYSKDFGSCKFYHYPCRKYELSVTFAFLAWFLTAVSSHLMFWILASI